jgi:metal-responsive CopG/Arc/MetJ family transcriptional regulator
VYMTYTRTMGRRPLGREHINITLPKGMPKAMLDAAAAEGRDRSSVIEELCREWLKGRENSKPARRGK